MKVKEIQEKEKINLQLRNKKKVQELKEKGITLIALVVTIIILLILAGVTLNMAMSGDGLFSKARNAAEKYKKAQEDDQDLISEIGKEMNSEYVGAYLEGYDPTGGTCKITKEQSGTKEDQEFSTEKEKTDGKELKWRIWDYDGTTLRIILDKPTTQKLSLNGAAGYNNGVWAINEICRKCFGKYDGEKMKTGIEVANLRRSDIQKVSTYDYTKYRHKIDTWEEPTEEEESIGFGDQKKYLNGNCYYPAIWKYDNIGNKKNLTANDRKLSACEREVINSETIEGRELGNSDTLFKDSYYACDYGVLGNKDLKGKYKDILFPGKFGINEFARPTWLSTRCVILFDDECAFDLWYMCEYSNRANMGGRY